MSLYYENDSVRLYQGDCREVLPTLGAVDHVITDPPYGVGFADWDAEIPDFWWLDWSRANAKVVAFTCGVTHMWRYPAPDWPLCWARPASVQHNGLGGFNHWEPVLIYGRPKLMVDLITLPHPGNAAGNPHPCPKPLGLYRQLVSLFTDPGETILDPFMGSGTTLVAAYQLGRKAVGIELEEKWCEVAVKRLEATTPPLFVEPAPKPVQATWEGWADTSWMVKGGYVSEDAS